MSGFTPEQIDVLLQGISPSRVAVMDGMSHLEGYDVRATLTRMFGFGRWDEVSLEPTELLYAEETVKRCAINLGDQFGLALYRKGATDALVRKVVGHKSEPKPTVA